MTDIPDCICKFAKYCDVLNEYRFDLIFQHMFESCPCRNCVAQPACNPYYCSLDKRYLGDEKFVLRKYKMFIRNLKS